MRISRKLTVVILAGGKGTRLLPITEKIPKALVPVAGLPILRYGVAWALAAGATKIVVSGGYLFDKVSEELSTIKVPVKIDCVPDEVNKPGNRINGVCAVRNHIDGDVLFLDGDYIYHEKISEQIANTSYSDVAVHATPNASKYMAQDVIVKVGGEMNFESMWKTQGTEPLKTGEFYFNSLLYVPAASAHKFFTAAREVAQTAQGGSLEDAVIRYQTHGDQVKVALFAEPLWVEIDTLEELAAAERFVRDHGQNIPVISR